MSLKQATNSIQMVQDHLLRDVQMMLESLPNYLKVKKKKNVSVCIYVCDR